MDYRYKIEIELDDEKIISDNKYVIESIYEAIRGMFSDEGIPEIKNGEHTMTFVSNRYDKDDFAAMALVENTLFDSEWFRPYVKKMIWYNIAYGKDYCEDVIKAYSEFDEKYGV